MTSDAVGLASEILTKLGFAQSESLEPGADVRRDDIAALIRRLEKERDEAQTIQLARMALAFERLTILRKMWSAQEVVNWIRGDAAIEMAAAIQRDHAEARNKALDEAVDAIRKCSTGHPEGAVGDEALLLALNSVLALKSPAQETKG